MIGDLARAIRERECILFAGAGVAMTVRLPSWRTLMEHMGAQLGFDPEVFADPEVSYFTLAEYYRLQEGSIGPLRSWMDRNWSIPEERLRTSKVHELIMRLDFPIVYRRTSTQPGGGVSPPRQAVREGGKSRNPRASSHSACPADRRRFQGALARGQVLVSARLADDRDGDRAAQILEILDPVDLDARSAQAGGGQGGGIGASVDVGAPLGAGLTGGHRYRHRQGATPGMGTLTDDTSTIGTADLGAEGMSLSDQGLSATPTGGRRGDARAGEPGVNELRRHGAGPAGAPGSTSAARWRDMARIGRVRS